MIKDDGNVIHFKNPKVAAALSANLFTISGNSETKPLMSMPDIFPQLGPEQIPLLKNMTNMSSLGGALAQRAGSGRTRGSCLGFLFCAAAFGSPRCCPPFSSPLVEELAKKVGAGGDAAAAAAAAAAGGDDDDDQMPGACPACVSSTHPQPLWLLPSAAGRVSRVSSFDPTPPAELVDGDDAQ